MRPMSKLDRSRGKALLLDGFVIFVVLAVVFLVAKQIFQQKTWVTAEIKITPEQWWFDSAPPPKWLALSIQKGDREISWNGATMAEVTDVRQYDTGYDRTFSYLTVRLLSEYDKKAQKFLYKNSYLDIGSAVELTLSKTRVQGLITDIPGAHDAREKVTKIVTLKLYDRYPWYAEAIAVGNAIEVNGVTIAEVIDKEVQISEMTSLSNNTTGQIDYQPTKESVYILRQNPNKRDITIKMKMLLTKDADGSLIYRDDQRILIGNQLFIALPNINLQYATVVSVE